MNTPAALSPRPLTQAEIAIIEECTQFTRNGYPDLPGEIQVCKMVKTLQGKLTTSLTSIQLALYLRSRTQLPRQTQTLPRPQPVLSYFKQFADTIKQEDPVREKREYVCKSKRKVKPTEPMPKRQLEELIQHCDSNVGDCNMLIERRYRKNSTQQAQNALNERCQWVYNEYFYSCIDRGFLKDEEPFVRLQQALRLNHEITYFGAKALRLALPKPRLFNSEFIASETERLNDFRNQLRSSPRQRKGGEWELSVGREVIALHPVCGHIHAGSILAVYKENLFMIKFTRPELGTQKVLDTNMALKEVAHPHRVIVQSVNFEVMALVIKLLEYKADLIALLGRYNDIAQEVQREHNGLDNRFYQQYGWIGSTINILSLGIRHILSRFRLRGIDSTNQDRIGRNFASVLLNPLNLMEKELDKSSQNSDIYASQQIKRIISSNKESRVQQYSRELFSRHWQSLKDVQWSTEQRQQFQVLMRCLVGILVSLRIEQKGFSIEQNKYLKELMNHFDNQFPQHFNEIYQLLASITAKLNQDHK